MAPSTTPRKTAQATVAEAPRLEDVDFRSDGSQADTLLGHRDDVESCSSELKSLKPAWASSKSNSFFSRFRTPTVLLFWTAAVSLFMICLFTFTTGLRWQFSIDQKCFEIESNNSPAAQEVDTAYQLVEFNSTADARSPYRSANGLPTPNVDQAWNDIQNVRPMAVSEEEVLRSGEVTDAVRLPVENGGGYLARAQIINEMACLNLMRKSLFYNWNYYKETAEFKQPYPELEQQIDGCVEMIRQVLMCNADTGLQLHHWEEGIDHPVPNTNTMHKCRNFDSVLDWTKKRQVPADLVLQKQE